MRQLVISKSTTNKDLVLQCYLREVNNEKMISSEEECALAKEVRAGSQEAVSKLVRANLRFVVSVAKQYQNHGLGLSDLINEGNIGLMKAATRFDERRGFKFISYAVWWIRQSITASITSNARTIRLPGNQITAARNLRKGQAQLEQDLEREASVTEMAEHLDVDTISIDKLTSITEYVNSLDAPMKEDSTQTLGDIFIDIDQKWADHGVDQESMRMEIDRALRTLTQRECAIVSAFYGLGNDGSKTLEEIGLLFGLTRERVRQIKENAIRKLRSTASVNLLKELL